MKEALGILTMLILAYEGRVDRFNIPVISVAKIAPNFMFKLPKVRLFDG